MSYENLETDEILKERIILYQHDLICLYESRMNESMPPTVHDLERERQDKVVIAELKRIWYKNGLDGLVYVE